MVDLRTTYLGLTLKNPVVPSASPLSEDVANIKRMEDFGASAVVMHSLFEEQLSHDAFALHTHLAQGTESFAEALSYFPEPDDFFVGPHEYLEHIRRAKETVDIPIIASLNGTTVSGWIDYAKQMEEAGADALECNVYYLPTDPSETGSDVEKLYLDILKAVKTHITIPVAMKLSPFFSNPAAMAHNLASAGADGLVLFNRFYQPDIDLDTLEVKPNLVLSSPFEGRLALRWIAILRGKVDTSLAATTGIHTGLDAARMILAGADVAQVCSVLLQKGIDQIGTVIGELASWMEDHEYTSVKEMKGALSQQSCPDPTAFERANYMKTLMSYPRS
ncbi:MAG TPA: dihydroorotate dehydrogenase-like protein [Thermoanaerobaculia bacterium]|nr:dihydroorotate dehydrogenase-like protein [Thermoanaerobaculia bacterium]HUM28714.1 dihydroorotate dehydrogenase-like protein [Thermoanaerobaculia bacterium]HXK68037.1 dihydroorotate dehydrogenase-like protein [Thermoanaerobaculia bacterium]